MPTTLLITSVSLILPLLPSGRPLPENHAGVDIAEAEARLDEHAQVGHRPRPARTQRRTPSGLGAVMLPPARCPPQFTAPPSTSARIGAPRSSALSRLSSRSTPAPAAGTKPAAEALIGREARSGASFDARVRTRMASNPAQL